MQITDTLPENVCGVWGHMHHTEAKVLYTLPEYLGEGLYADIGTWQGNSAILMAGGLKNRGISGTVFTVDSFDSRGMTGSSGKNTYGLAVIHMEERGLLDMIQVYKGDSVEAANSASNRKFRFIFIDADHSYEGVSRDFEAWSPLLDVGGWMGFHDTGAVGVKRFLSELGSEWLKVDQVRSLSWWANRDH